MRHLLDDALYLCTLPHETYNLVRHRRIPETFSGPLTDS